MSFPYHYEPPEINPSEKHDVKFNKEPKIFHSENNTNRYVKVKPACSICGATEETSICNRTFYS